MVVAEKFYLKRLNRSSTCQRLLYRAVSLPLDQGREPFIGGAYPPVVPVTDEISSDGGSVPPLSFFLCRIFHRWALPSSVPTCFRTVHCHGSVLLRCSCFGKCRAYLLGSYARSRNRMWHGSEIRMGRKIFFINRVWRNVTKHDIFI